jgi:FKBP-type peptidyl-prolyl cis-trans isomerase FklB
MSQLPMRSLPSTATALFAAGIMLAANLQAQQTSTQKTPPASTSKSQPASGAKSTAASKGPSSLQTDKEKESYAIGMNIATTLQHQAVEVDPKILAQGIADALAGGGKTLLTDDEAKAVLAQLQEKMQAAQEAKIQEAADANKKAGDAYLAANHAKEGVVTLPSGLQYRVLRQGTGPKPAATDTVICNYEGTLIDGKVFDSSYERGQPVTIPVARVIKGFTEALQLMPVGSKWELVVPPDLAYGVRGAGNDIGPNSTIIFDVELLSIQQPGEQGSGEPDSPKPNGNGNGNPRQAPGQAPGQAPN